MKIIILSVFSFFFVMQSHAQNDSINIDEIPRDRGIELDRYQSSALVNHLNSDLGICSIENSEYDFHLMYFVSDQLLLNIWLEDSVYQGNIYRFTYFRNKSDKPVEIYNINQFLYNKIEIPDSIMNEVNRNGIEDLTSMRFRTYCGRIPLIFPDVILKRKNRIENLCDFKVNEKLWKYLRSFYQPDIKSDAYYDDYYFKLLRNNNSSVSAQYTSREEENYYENHYDYLGELEGYDRFRKKRNVESINTIRR